MSYNMLGYVLYLKLAHLLYKMAAMRNLKNTNLTGGSCPPILGGVRFCTPLFLNFGPGGNALKLPKVVLLLLRSDSRICENRVM